MVSLAIIGSRSFEDYDRLCNIHCDGWDITLKDILCVVGGHCKGADLLGEKFAREHNIKICALTPNWKKYGRSAGFQRNHDIIKAATHVLAFPSKNGSGTQHSIKLAQKAHKPCGIVYFDA